MHVAGSLWTGCQRQYRRDNPIKQTNGGRLLLLPTSCSAFPAARTASFHIFTASANKDAKWATTRPRPMTARMGETKAASIDNSRAKAELKAICRSDDSDSGAQRWSSCRLVVHPFFKIVGLTRVVLIFLDLFVLVLPLRGILSALFSLSLSSSSLSSSSLSSSSWTGRRNFPRLTHQKLNRGI